jgi:hypothetical protein
MSLNLMNLIQSCAGGMRWKTPTSHLLTTTPSPQLPRHIDDLAERPEMAFRPESRRLQIGFGLPYTCLPHTGIGTTDTLKSAIEDLTCNSSPKRCLSKS